MIVLVMSMFVSYLEFRLDNFNFDFIVLGQRHLFEHGNFNLRNDLMGQFFF